MRWFSRLFTGVAIALLLLHTPGGLAEEESKGICIPNPSFQQSYCTAIDLRLQNSHKNPKQPPCSVTGGSANKRTIGYWQSWTSSDRSCDAWSTLDIDATKWTHLNFAYATIDPNTHCVAQVGPVDVQRYAALTDLKRDNPGLKVFITIVGFGDGGSSFREMVATAAGRGVFVGSLERFLRQYAFDGVDLDWFNPIADTRDGAAIQFNDFVVLLQELRAVLGTRYGITTMLPSSDWYLRAIDVNKMEQYVDWFNVMRVLRSNVVQAHSNLTEINKGLDMLWRKNVDPSKVVLGLGFYGKTFTLQDPACSKPGCPYVGAGAPGPCTGLPGMLSNSEIQQDVIGERHATPTLAERDAVKYMTYDKDQWVSYDDEETLRMKRDYANRLCLGGLLVWALDLDKPGEETSINNLLAFEPSPRWHTQASRRAVTRSNAMSLGLFWTPCQEMGVESCPKGYQSVASGHGKVFDADLTHLAGEGCHGGGITGFQRTLCGPANIQFANLMWGPGGRSKACNSRCPRGWVTLTKNSHPTGQRVGCKSGRYVPLCASEYVLAHHDLNTAHTTYASHILSGGLSQRPDCEGRFGHRFIEGRPWENDSGGDVDGAQRRAPRQGSRHEALGGCAGDETSSLSELPLNVPVRFERQTLENGFNFWELEPIVSAT